MNIGDYLSPDNHASILHNVPIQYLDEVKEYFRKKFLRQTTYINGKGTVRLVPRIVYRGPRTRNVDPRSYFTRQAYCLKKNATHFAVYVVLK